MIHPTDNESTNEWIELYNPTNSAIDLNGWTITDGQEEDSLQADQTHSDGTTQLLPGAYGLITDQGTNVYKHFTIPENTIRLSVDDSTLCGYGLNNNNEKLLLKDQVGVIVDAVEWGKDYTDVPGTPAPTVSQGHSLNRQKDVDTDNTQTDFFDSSTPTPGAENILTLSEPPANQTALINQTTTIATTLVITQLYYHTHTSMNNEFITLYNPTNTTKDISNWYLTDEPWKEPTKQAKLQFPDHTIIPPNTSLTVTQNATAYEKETARLPNFEYKVNAQSDIPQLITFKTVTLSDAGGLLALINTSNTIVDLVIYGNTTQTSPGWNGLPIPSVTAGVILTRITMNGTPQDTDTAADWLHPRIYRIGQSDFPTHMISFTGDVTLFVSPDNSYQTITQELRSAQHTIDINMYEFTSPALCTELLNALKRNITLRLFMEGSPIGGISEKEKTILATLAHHGCIIRFLASDSKNHVTARYQFDHAKYIIIDNTTVIVESCNWAKTGVPKNPTYGNREWGIVIRNNQTAEYFAQVFRDDWNPHHQDSYSFEAMNLSITSWILDDETPKGSYTPRFSATTINQPCIITPLFSPDTSEKTILDAIDTATTTIYIQQLYIYKDWDNTISPFFSHLITKSQQGVTINVIMDYNPAYKDTTATLNETKQYLEQNGVHVKFLSTQWSPFTAVHNKGMIIDNTTVLVSSINWNEQSVRGNREAGIILQNHDAATYYAAVFLSDWNLDTQKSNTPGFSLADLKYYVLIAVVFSITLALIVRDWRKRKWK